MNPTQCNLFDLCSLFSVWGGVRTERTSHAAPPQPNPHPRAHRAVRGRRSLRRRGLAAHAGQNAVPHPTTPHECALWRPAYGTAGARASLLRKGHTDLLAGCHIRAACNYDVDGNFVLCSSRWVHHDVEKPCAEYLTTPDKLLDGTAPRTKNKSSDPWALKS